MNNALLASLAAEREARKRPRTPDSTSAKRVKSASVIDLCDSDDDEDDSDAASLALARRLQHNQSSSSEEASMALARKLQAEELLPFGIPSSGLHVVAPGTPNFFLALKQDADRYRRDCEGPPSAPWTILTDLDGTKQRVKRAEHGWRPSHPVVSCSDADCLRQLRELGGPPPPGGVVCANPSNAPLMRLLCSWRQHVRETKFEYQAPGAKTWRVTSICTSELTWLGRKTAKVRLM